MASARTRLRVAVVASGRGSNLGALIAATAQDLPIELVGVFSDKPAAAALELARGAGIPALALAPRDYADRHAHDQALFAAVDAVQPQLIVLAGYMRRISPDVVEPRSARMINIHPSLLPKYPGLDTHARALAAGDREHGASVHFVTPELDGGPVIAQVLLEVGAADSPESLAARLLPDEHRLLVAVVDAIARGRIALADSGVLCDGHRLSAPLRLGRDGTLAPRAPTDAADASLATPKG